MRRPKHVAAAYFRNQRGHVTLLARTAFYLGLISFALSAQESRQDDAGSRDWAALREAGYASFHAGRYAEAARDFEQSLQLARTREQRAATLAEIGYSLSELGRMKEAFEKLHEALSMWRQIDPRGPAAAEAGIWVGNADRVMDRFAEAERTLRAALDASPRDDAERAAVLTALASMLEEQGRFTEAREKFEAALRLSPAGGENRVDTLLGLGETERATREWQPALEHFNEAIALARQMRKAGFEASALRNVGNTYLEMGNFAKAEYFLRRALAILETMPALQIQFEETLVCIGNLYGAEKKHALAEDAYMRALSARGGLNASDARSAMPLQYLALIRAHQKRFQEATDLAYRAYRIMTTTFGAESIPAAGALGTVVVVETLAGEFESAERHYSESLRIMRAQGVLNSDAGLGVMSGYAGALKQMHRVRDFKAVEGQLKTFRTAK
jgi:tetratricopeptide (TPR) repeat protein